jgi:hypothetical protein
VEEESVVDVVVDDMERILLLLLGRRWVLVLENLVAVAAVKKDGDDALLIRDD